LITPVISMTRRRHAPQRAILRVIMSIVAAMLFGVAAHAAETPQSAATKLIADAKAVMLTSPQLAAQKASAARQLLSTLTQTPALSQQLATAEWLEGEAEVRLGMTDAAQPRLDDAWSRIANQPTPTKLTGDLLVSMGWLATSNSDLATALAKFHRAYRVFVAIKDARSQSLTLMAIASLYNQAAQYSTAIRYYSEALEAYRLDDNLEVSLYNNLGNTLQAKGDYAKALDNYTKALKIAKRMRSVSLQGRVQINLAQLFLANKELALARKSIDIASELNKENHDGDMENEIKAISADIDLANGNLNAAKSELQAAFASPDFKDDAVTLRDAHLTAYRLYKKLGDYRQALSHLEAQKELSERDISLTASANTALMGARFDYANQNLKIAKLQAQDLERKIKYERAHAQTMRLVFVSAGGVTLGIIGLLTVGLIVIRRSRNEERAAKDDLAVTNAALAKALAAKTEFLATTSHEIRTPLNGILGMTQVMLADRALAAETRDRLELVEAAGKTMRALVDDILDVAKMETGNMTIERAPMDVCAVLRDVARLWEDQAQARGLEFALELDRCPAMIQGDAARIRQIVFNLLSNATKFTERGRITLHGSVVATATGDRVRIEIADTGIGIPPDKLETIFESFRQADASTTRRYGGTGLGLAICRNLARAMDGDVTVVSTLGIGTRFTVDLPLILPAATAAGGAEAAPAALLIADRNPITRSMLRALMEPAAGTVDVVPSLAEAAGRAAAGGIAQVLVDDATALAAGEAIDDHLRTLGASPASIALLWTDPDAEIRARFAGLGVTNLIAKPIAGPALRDTLFPADAMNRDGEPEHNLVSDAA
jgi:signal transduction histidine kinase